MNRHVDAVMEIDHGVIRPQEQADPFPKHDFTSIFQEKSEDFDRLFRELDPSPELAQLARCSGIA